MRRSASGSANEDKLPITSTTLNTGVKILQNLPWMPKVCYSLLFNQSLCMGLKLAIVVFSFQLGHISIFRAYTNLLVAYIRFGGTMSRHVWIWRRFIQCKGIFPTCCKPPIIYVSDTTNVAILAFWTQSFCDLNSSRIAT